MARFSVLLIVTLLAGVAIHSQPAPPRRIVSLVPAVTEMLFAMGAGAAVVGVSSHDRFPPEAAALPRVGALVDPDVERVLSLRPDLVIVYGSQAELIQRLARAGISSFQYRHGGLAEITGTIRDIGQRIGRSAEANAVASRMEGNIAQIRRQVASRPRPATLVVIGREPGGLRAIYASAGVGFLHDMLVAAGGRDVFADVPRESLQVSVEVLLARAPDVILELRPSDGWTGDRIARERAVWNDVPALPAVRANQIHILADDRLLVPGPRVADAVRRFAATLHPGAFAARPSAPDLSIVLLGVPPAARRVRLEATRGDAPRHGLIGPGGPALAAESRTSRDRRP